MQRKQQVGECWVCVIFFACVCVGTSDMTTASDDPYFGRFLLFLADFAIFSNLLKIISVLGIRVLVSTKYLKTLYILYSEW
jgi:hypothetical protein